MNELIIYVDAAARGNPGPAAIAGVIKGKQGETITTVSKRIGTSTNNQAEYRAIILGLEKAITLGAKLVEVRSDSELIVRQILDIYQVNKPTLLPLYQRVKQLGNSLASFAIIHIPREQNNEANNLVNKTLNLVKHIGYAEACQLIVKIKQSDNNNDDIRFLNRLINILRDFPGSDSVSLSVDVKDKRMNLKLSSMHVNYCYELREQLRRMSGKKWIIVKPLE